MFFKIVLFLLSSSTLFKAFAMGSYYRNAYLGPCSGDDFLCKKESYYYECTKLSNLCDNYENCENGKDQICDGKLHILTGICNGGDEKHCKGLSRGTAICSPGCAQCTGRDECAACTVNFSGKYCNETCPSGTFGSSCEFDCDYLMNEKSKFYSLCYSDDSVCDSKDVSNNCRATCECKRAKQCEPGLIGNNCQVPCPGFTFGRFCSKKCTCVQENSVGCNKKDGTCNCKPNYYGKNCEGDCNLIKSQFSESNLKCLERKVQTLSDDKTTLEQRLDDHKTAAQKKLEDHKISLEQTLKVHKSEIEQKVGASVGKEEFERNLAGHKKAIDDHKSSLQRNFDDHKKAGEQKLADHKSSLEQRLGNHERAAQKKLEDHKSSLEQRLGNYETAAQKELEDHKTSLEQTLNFHKSEIEQKIGAFVGKEEFESNLAGHRKALDDYKSSLDQKFGRLIDEKAALEERMGDYNHLTWNSWLICAALALLFVLVGKMYIKNRKLKADLKLISVRYSRRQQSASVEETRVTFCNETTNSPAQSNLFQSALGRVRRLTQHVPNSNNLPICGMSLLGETNQANANPYETIEELKQKAKKATTRIQKS